jgi:hypothetical protein
VTHSCPSCGAALPPAAVRFCLTCGHRLTSEGQQTASRGRAVDEQDYDSAAEKEYGAVPGERYSAAPGEDDGNPLASGVPAPPGAVTAPDPVTAEWQQRNDLMSSTAAQRSEQLFDHLGLTDQPSGRERPVEESTDGRHRKRWLIAVAAVLLVAVGGAAAALFLLHSSRGKSVATGGSTSPTSNVQPSQSPSENPPPSPSPAPSEVTVNGVAVDISAVSTNASATAVAQTLGTYFGGIDSQNYTQAYNTLTPSLQASIPYQNWSSGLATTKDTSVVVQTIQHDPNGDVNATVSFQSHQAPQYGPVAGDTCDNWILDYRLVPSDSVSPPYLIQKVKPVGAGYQAC